VPTAQALRHGAEVVAQGRLRYLDDESVRVTEQQGGQRLAGPGLAPEMVGAHPQGPPRTLDERLMWGDLIAEKKGEAHHPFAADDGHLGLPASVLGGQDRYQPGPGKIGVGDTLARVVQDLAESQGH